ncbi:MAG: hypothetical protein LAP21_08160 [Acidobacteriia bacterium]|nr:hypothetical protein [Terriglobia bacterium]
MLALSLSAGAQTPANVGELFATEATPNGPLMKAGAGMPVASGSQLSAGKSPATLRLERGGEVKICPYSHLSVSSSSGHAALLFAVSVSSIEMSYPINELSDTLITPDFKLSLTGPGTFHFAVGVNSRGDTCLRSLRGNSGVIVVSELMGAAAFTLKPEESVLFAGGKISGRAPLTSACGCPAPAPVLKADTHPQAPSEPASQPTKSPGDVHISVEAPLVFRGDQAVQQAYSVARVNFSRLPNVFLLQEKVEPALVNGIPVEEPKKPKEHKGFFGAIKGFFASIFKR